MARQFKRKASLVVASGTEGLDLSELRFTFKIQQANLEAPQSCTIVVYNLSDETAKRISEREFTRVILQAGYEDGNYGLIFDGTIIQPRRGRDNPTDSYVSIMAAEGDAYLNSAYINTSISAGAGQTEIISSALGKSVSASAADVPSLGYVPVDTSVKLPRGKVLFGMTRDVLHQVAATAGQSYFIAKGQINFVPLDGVIPGEAVLVNNETGMIGWPVQTQDGIEVVTLLNPLLAIGSTLKIDNASILAAQYSTAYTFIPENLPQIDNDGLYKIHVIEHSGDTRGNDWYSKMVTLSVNPDNARLTGLIAKGQY